MKKIGMKAILSVLVLTAVFFTTCGKNSSEGNKHEKGKKAENGNTEQKKGGEIDIDKLDIPDRMKKAIKSGRIPMERVKQFLEMRKGTGNAPLVKVEQVQPQGINAFLVLNGVVEPERKVEVYSRLSAYVKEIVKEEGALMKKGSVLALLDDTEIRISYRQAEIQLQQAELTLKDEETNLQRSKELKEKDMISEQDFQLSHSNYNKAKLDHQNKRESFKDLELQLSYTKITAPVDGYVTERLIEVGGRVNANQQAYTVEDFSPLLIKVYVPTSDVVNLEKGMETEVTTDVLKGRLFKGKIKLINPRIDVQSGTVKVTIEVFDETQTLKPGMFVETNILIRNKPDALVIPRKSITYKQDRAFVFVLKREGMQITVSRRDVKTGISEGDNIEVTGGLEQGERIVTVGVAGLKDNMKVSVQGFQRGPGMQRRDKKMPDANARK
jgi:RND family efflux transporter MFP subunit